LNKLPNVFSMHKGIIRILFDVDYYPTLRLLYPVTINSISIHRLLSLVECNIFFYFLDPSRVLGPLQYCHSTSIDTKSASNQTNTVVPTQFSINQPGND